MGRWKLTLIERFWSKVERRGESECWLWKAHTNKAGYGCFSFKSGILAHRFAWILENGDIPSGLGCLHRCDNPPCVNPSHLFLGTQADNVVDMIAKGRKNPARGSSHPSSKLTAAAVSEIRQSLDLGGTLRSIARRFGVSHQAIHAVKSRASWGHIS